MGPLAPDGARIMYAWALNNWVAPCKLLAWVHRGPFVQATKVRLRQIERKASAHPARLPPARATSPNEKQKVSGFFSDLLFQPHHCATTTVKPEWVRRSTVDRRAGLTPEEFRRLYEEPNKPVVLTDAAAR